MNDTAPDCSSALAEVLLASLQQLAAAGETEIACQLAGKACAILRLKDARAWSRFNALLHRLTRPRGPTAD